MDDLTEKIQGLLADPESMQQISELASMLQAPGETAPATVEPAVSGGNDGFDPAMLLKLGELMRTQSAPDKNAALLLALRPHLGERRQLRVDKAVKLLRLYSMWKTAQASGMLRDLL
ncbi:MAG: hypothetical protein II916_00860 [Oscillospiraceae bacterium]|nr:hypothetical protein [Oscillospiraceae bacterium]